MKESAEGGFWYFYWSGCQVRSSGECFIWLGASHVSIFVRNGHNDARGWWFIANDVLKMRKVIVCPATAPL